MLEDQIGKLREALQHATAYSAELYQEIERYRETERAYDALAGKGDRTDDDDDM